MRKMFKKLLSVALVFAMVMCLVPPVEAQASTKAATLKNKKWYTNTDTWSSEKTLYHKIKVPKDGYITLQGYGYSSSSSSTKYSLRYRLCNSKKKALTKWDQYLSSGSSNYTGTKAYTNWIAVKKGTYYIKVKDYQYKLRYTFKAVKDQGGSSKAKAKTIAKGKTIKGLAVAGEKGSKVDWYKITLPKAQTIKLTLNGKACGWMQFDIVGFTGFGACWSKKETASTNKVPAGTYYIKAYRMNKDKDTSGYYTISWK